MWCVRVGQSKSSVRVTLPAPVSGWWGSPSRGWPSAVRRRASARTSVRSDRQHCFCRHFLTINLTWKYETQWFNYQSKRTQQRRTESHFLVGWIHFSRPGRLITQLRTHTRTKLKLKGWISLRQAVRKGGGVACSARSHTDLASQRNKLATVLCDHSSHLHPCASQLCQHHLDSRSPRRRGPCWSADASGPSPTQPSSLCRTPQISPAHGPCLCSLSGARCVF